MIKKVVKFTTFEEQEKEDRAYWLSRTSRERIEAMTFLIEQHHGLTDETPERLQRVLTVTKRSLR